MEVNFEFITFIIAVIGFGISIYNFILEKIRSAKRIYFTINHAFSYGKVGVKYSEIIDIEIHNKSYSPITISKIEITGNNSSDFYGERIMKYSEHKMMHKEDVEYKGVWYSMILPVRIEPNSFYRGALISSNMLKVLQENKKHQIVFYTSKGPITKEFFLKNFAKPESITEFFPPKNERI